MYIQSFINWFYGRWIGHAVGHSLFRTVRVPRLWAYSRAWSARQSSSFSIFLVGRQSHNFMSAILSNSINTPVVLPYRARRTSLKCLPVSSLGSEVGSHFLLPVLLRWGGHLSSRNSRPCWLTCATVISLTTGFTDEDSFWDTRRAKPALCLLALG